MDSFVVRTDYEDFAVMLQLSTEKLWGNKSTNLVLYSEWRKAKRRGFQLRFDLASFPGCFFFFFVFARSRDGRDLWRAGRL